MPPFPLEHRKRSSKAGGQCLGGWPPLAVGWHAGPRMLKGAGARKICRGSNALHILIIPLGVPSQVTISHLEVGSKLRDPISEQKSDFHPHWGSPKNGSRSVFPLPVKRNGHDNNNISWEKLRSHDRKNLFG